MNKYEFVPKMPNSSDLEMVFDTSFHDVQPHLFKVCKTRGFFYISSSQICVTGVPQHCQRGQPGGGHQHGEEASEGHPCHLEEEEETGGA